MESLREFGVQPVLLAAQVVNFLLLLFILKKFLYKPILSILEKRKELVVQTLKNAEESEKKLIAANETAEKIVSKALEQAEKILDDVNKQGALTLEEVNKKAEEILKRAFEQAREIGEAEKVKIEEQLREYVANIVLQVTAKSMGKILSPKDKKEIFEKGVKNIS